MLWLEFVEFLARFILVILIFLSIWSVKIIIERHRFFKSISLPGPKIKEASRNSHTDDSVLDSEAVDAKKGT